MGNMNVKTSLRVHRVRNKQVVRVNIIKENRKQKVNRIREKIKKIKYKNKF